MKQTKVNIFEDQIESRTATVLRKYGRLVLVLLITLISIVVSVLITYLFASNIQGVSISASMIIALIVPSVVAPLTSWVLIGQFEKINAMEQTMRELATYDSQTGLLTRQAFYHDAESYLNIIKRNPDYFSVMMLDIDHFKVVNDTYGHHIGDFVLERFGTFFLEHLRNSDIVGRLGGEEFAVILPHTLSEDAQFLAEAIRADLENLTITKDSVSLSVTASIGISHYTQNVSSDINRILKDADIALYRAKQTGRNRTVLLNAVAAAS
jgi:diguanylate cyclase (GGDEF)-like protein